MLCVQITRVEGDVPDSGRPVYFIYSGMGSQWPCMGRALMQLPVARESLLKCAQALKHPSVKKNIDLLQLLNDADEEALKSTATCMLCITAVQVQMIFVVD